MKRLLSFIAFCSALSAFAADSSVNLQRGAIYGELYLHDNSTAQVLTNAGTYYTITPAMTQGNTNGVTVATSTNSITVAKAGLYRYTGSFSFSGTPNKTIEVAAFTNGVEAINSDVTRKISSGGDVGSAAKMALLWLNAGDYVQVKATADDASVSVTWIQGNFSLQLVR